MALHLSVFRKIQQRFLFFSLLTLIATLASCTTIDNEFGQGFIPEDQLMTMRIDTLYDVESFVVRTDSIPTNNLTANFFGSFESPIFGRTTGSFITQYVPGTFKDEKVKFGISPIADSLILSLSIPVTNIGDTTVEQQFNIYEVTAKLHRDSTYYPNFDAMSIVNPTPLATFAVKHNTKTVKLTGAAIEAFSNRMFDTSDNLYESDTLFFKVHKGLYFAPTASSPTNASMLSLTMSSSGMTLYYRNHDEQNNIKDTTSMIYSFVNDEYSPATTINVLKRDYAGTPIQQINDFTAPQNVCYIQSLNGVNTEVKITKTFVEKLLSKVAPSTGYKNIVINKARLQVAVNEESTPYLVLADAPRRVGLYTKYNNLSPITDYDYIYEQQNSVTLPFGGFLNRTHNFYDMDITIMTQELLKTNDGKGSKVILGNQAGSVYGFERVVLNGSDGGGNPDPMMVIVTYTLVR